MVDRYFLPIPKHMAINSYVYRKNSKLFTRLSLLGASLLGFQIYRLTTLRSSYSKPAGYYLDWDSPDAPKKVTYFSN